MCFFSNELVKIIRKTSNDEWQVHISKKKKEKTEIRYAWLNEANFRIIIIVGNSIKIFSSFFNLVFDNIYFAFVFILPPSIYSIVI